MSITREQILRAHQRISPYVLRTPVVRAKSLEAMLNCELFLKCENRQKIGAFKARGAMNAVLLLSESDRKKGVATHSSGNHAQALALAAREFGLKAWIVMPENSSPVKIAGVKALGAEVIFCAPGTENRRAALDQVVAQHGALFIPPYDHPHIIEGQASAAKELIEEIPGLDLILVPVGGGGLLSGTALAAHYLSPSTSVYGCEPENMDDAHRSFLSGKPEPLKEGSTTVADGLRTTLGILPLTLIKKYVKGILTVPEQEILPAMEFIRVREGEIIEPSSAVPVAALLRNKRLIAGKRVGVILSGGNVNKADN
ncbi:MAG: threonine/serine dehydratase [Bacteroidia bacterium]|nr:threonine/serine dehydratase [Bacteroidia bacterium]